MESLKNDKAQERLVHPVEFYFNKLSRYQFYIFSLTFASEWPLFFHMLNHFVITPKVKFYCGGEELSNGSYTGDLNKCPCSEKVYWDRSVFTSTTQMKFDLYCEREWLIGASKSMGYIGLFFGVTAFGLMADKFGRLPTLSLTYIITGVFGCLSTIMPEIYSFCIIRIIEGFGAGGGLVVVYVYIIEYCGPKNRPTISAICHLPLEICHCSLGLLSYLLRDWTHAMIAMSVPCIIFGFLPLLIMESPKWLVDTGKTERAAKVMMKVCKFNKLPCDDVNKTIDLYLLQQPKGIKAPSILQCLKHKQIAINTVLMAVLFFTCGFGFYGVSQFISEMSDCPFIDISLSGACLIPGTILSMFLINVLKRKVFVIGNCLLAALFFVPVVFLNTSMHMLRVVFASISNCFFSMLFVVSFLYGCEIFPTSTRNSMLGLLSMVSRVGTILAPLIVTIRVNYIECIFPILALFTAVLMLYPPETKDTILPATIEETLDINKKKPIFKRNNKPPL